MAELTVAAGIARGLMELAVARGAAADVLAQRSGIAPSMLQDQDRRVPFAAYVALMRAAKELCGDPALALHYAEQIDLSEVSIVGLLGHAAETMLDAFAQLNRYGQLVVEVEVEVEAEAGGAPAAGRFRLAREHDGLWLIDTRKHPDRFPELTESTFARMVCGTRRFGDTPFVTAVQVTHADPGYRAEYERILRAPVAFGSARNAMRIDDAWLTHRIALQPRYVFGILSQHAQALLEQLEQSKSTRGRVECLLMAVLHTGSASMDLVCAKLGLSRQTLFRKLKAEGTTFEQVLDQLRHTLALHYLDGKRASVNETAYLVGFSDPAAFSRAFKRWTGKTPTEAREGRPTKPSA